MALSSSPESNESTWQTLDIEVPCPVCHGLVSVEHQPSPGRTWRRPATSWSRASLRVEQYLDHPRTSDPHTWPGELMYPGVLRLAPHVVSQPVHCNTAAPWLPTATAASPAWVDAPCEGSRLPLDLMVQVRL